MTYRSPESPARRGVAAVELALLLPFLLVLVIGVWEVGRMIEVQQMVHNAAREGARLAAQGRIINKFSAPTEIHVNTGTPNVEETVRNYLREAGIDTTGMQVTFAFTNGDVTRTQPYEADKGQRFRVQVTLPYQNVRWSLLGLVNPTSLVSTVEWQSLVDDPFTLDTTIPTW